jgi:predicted short-subunit dehydrogenase-like oxidoreductase (DUF2520 family)
MSIAFIGAGKVSKTFGLYLKNHGVAVAGYYSRTYQSAVDAAALIGTVPYRSLTELLSAADIILITTPDDVISAVVAQIQAEITENAELAASLPDKSFAHMSGVHSSELLKPLHAMGATTFSLHPLLAFTEPVRSAEALEGAYFAIDGSGAHYQQIIDQLEQIIDKLIEIAPAQKALYHAASAVIANYQIAIIDLGLTMLTELGYTREQALQLAEPLVRQNVDNLFALDCGQALSGPIARGDAGTVAKHVAAITATNQEWLDLYRRLGSLTIELASRAQRINAEQVTKLKEVLNNDE